MQIDCHAYVQFLKVLPLLRLVVKLSFSVKKLFRTIIEYQILIQLFYTFCLKTVCQHTEILPKILKKQKSKKSINISDDKHPSLVWAALRKVASYCILLKKILGIIEISLIPFECQQFIFLIQNLSKWFSPPWTKLWCGQWW